MTNKNKCGCGKKCVCVKSKTSKKKSKIATKPKGYSSKLQQWRGVNQTYPPVLINQLPNNYTDLFNEIKDVKRQIGSMNINNNNVASQAVAPQTNDNNADRLKKWVESSKSIDYEPSIPSAPSSVYGGPINFVATQISKFEGPKSATSSLYGGPMDFMFQPPIKPNTKKRPGPKPKNDSPRDPTPKSVKSKSVKSQSDKSVNMYDHF